MVVNDWMVVIRTLKHWRPHTPTMFTGHYRTGIITCPQIELWLKDQITYSLISQFDLLLLELSLVMQRSQQDYCFQCRGSSNATSFKLECSCRCYFTIYVQSRWVHNLTTMLLELHQIWRLICLYTIRSKWEVNVLVGTTSAYSSSVNWRPQFSWITFCM
jgi:hypothetical protein